MNRKIIFKNVKWERIVSYYTVELIANNGYRYTYFSSTKFDEVSEIFNRVLKELKKNNLEDAGDCAVLIAENYINNQSSGWSNLVQANRENDWAVELRQSAFFDDTADDEDEE